VPEDLSKSKQGRLEGVGTSGTIKDMTTRVSDVGEALKTVIATTGNHSGAISVPIRYAHPGESADRRLMYAIVADG
jgi:hypothetical protein